MKLSIKHGTNIKSFVQLYVFYSRGLMSAYVLSYTLLFRMASCVLVAKSNGMETTRTKENIQEYELKLPEGKGSFRLQSLFGVCLPTFVRYFIDS